MGPSRLGSLRTWGGQTRALDLVRRHSSRIIERLLMDTEPDILVLPDIETESRDQLAPLWKVVCHDDPITTMDFVIEVLTKVFRQPMARAFELMYRVHYSGTAVIGLWPESVARRKVARAHAMARADGFPLTFSVEEED